MKKQGWKKLINQFNGKKFGKNLEKDRKKIMKSTIRIGNSILDLLGIVFIGESYPNNEGIKPYGITIVHELFKVIIWFSNVNIRDNQLEISKNLFEKFKNNKK